MAGATASQAAVLASPAFRISNRARVSHFFPTPHVPQLRRSSYRINTSIKCMAEGDEKLQEKQKMRQTQPEPVTSAPAAKVSTKFSDVLAFSGPAPERINGRLAMIGFVAALAVELFKGQDVLDQISNGGITWFLGTSIVLSLASLIPLFKGVSVESKSDGFMTSDAELWNGRFAMLGLVALAFTEYVKGGALV